MLWRLPAMETFKWRSRASASAACRSSTSSTCTTECTRVELSRLTSSMSCARLGVNGPRKSNERMRTMVLYLPRKITCPNHAGLDDSRVDAAQMKLSSQRRIDELQGIGPEPLHELLAAGMGLVRHLDDRGPQRQAGSWRQVGSAQVQIDEKLVARKLPSVGMPGHQGDHPGIHDVELHVRMGRPVRCAGAPPSAPVVPDEAFHQIELGFVEHLAL